MTVPDLMVFTPGAIALGLITYGLWCFPVKPWIAERMWCRDERRLAVMLRDREMACREQQLGEAAAALGLMGDREWDEIARLERWLSLPCAPDPERLP